MVLMGVGVSTALLWLAFRDTDFSEIRRHAAEASIAILSLVLVTKAAALTAAAVRSVVILRKLHPYTFWQVLKSLLVGYFGNAALPFRAGEVMRVAYLARESDGNVPPTSAIAVLVVERMMDSLCLLLLLVCVVLSGVAEVPVGTVVYAVGALIAIGMAVLVWVSRSPERVTSLFARSTFLSDKVRRFANGLAALRRGNGLAAVAVATAAYWGCQALAISVWVWAFGLSLPWYAPMVVLVFIAFGAALPSAPGFIGTYHFFAISAFVLLGADRSAAASVATVGHFLAIVPPALLGAAVLAAEFRARPDRGSG